MDESTIQKRVIWILAILSLMLFIAAISSCSSAYRQKINRDKEVYSRLASEEKMNKFLQEKKAAEEKIKTAEKGLAEERAALEALKRALVQEQLVNQSLKEELAKVTKLKEALEEDLKQSLVGGKQAKTKK